MTDKIRLLVRADDAGSSWSSNVGCLRACTEGIARSVEVMMPCPWTRHAADLFNAHPYIDIGVHLTLTSEWEAIKWRPLTPAGTLCDEHGFFPPLVMPRKGDTRLCLANMKWSIDEIALEFRSQIELGISLFRSVSHISSHMIRHFKELDHRIGEIVSDLCDEFNIADDAFGHGLPRLDGYAAYPRDVDHRVSSFKEALSILSGGTYIFIDHPAEPSPELEASGHKGYEDVAADRTSCLGALTSGSLQEHIEQLGIELISYKQL